MNWMTILGGRRFMLTVGTHLISTGLLAFHLLTEGGYVTLILATVGVYIAGNTTQKIMNKAGPAE